MILVYLLFESSTETIFYVGKTNNLPRRLTQHRATYHGISINAEILETVDDCAWEESEKYWISLLRDEYLLGIVNKLNGGNQWPLDSSKLGGKIASKNRGMKNKGRLSPFKGKKRSEVSASLIGKPHPHKNSRKDWTTKTSSKGGIGRRRVNDVTREFPGIEREKARRIYYNRKESGYYG